MDCNKTTIFVVDDHPIVRQGISQLINQEDDMICVGEAADAASALDQIATLKPRLALVDISLQGVSGLELTKKITTYHPATIVLIISMHKESCYFERSLRAGARGYIMKQEAIEHIAEAIRAALRGEIYVNHEMRSGLMNKYIDGEMNITVASPKSLSDRELEVFQLIGQGFATRSIAAALHVSVKTIESHYANIKAKLDLKNSHELIQHAVKWQLAEK